MFIVFEGLRIEKFGREGFFRIFLLWEVKLNFIMRDILRVIGRY